MKWFSLSLFSFLSLLIVGFAYTRPERVNAVADNTGAFFDALGATLILLVQIGVGAGGLARVRSIPGRTAKTAVVAWLTALSRW